MGSGSGSEIQGNEYVSIRAGFGKGFMDSVYAKIPKYASVSWLSLQYIGVFCLDVFCKV